MNVTEVYIMSDGLSPAWAVMYAAHIYVSGVTWGMVTFMKFQPGLDLSSEQWPAKLGQWLVSAGICNYLACMVTPVETSLSFFLPVNQRSRVNISTSD